MKFSDILVNFYRLYYGRLNLKGMGFFLNKAARFLPALQAYPLPVTNIGIIPVDFRDHSAFVWQNYLLGKKYQEHGLLMAMSGYCIPGGVLWDIGANIGVISAFFANPKYKLKAVHAFEPNPEMFSAIEALFAESPIVHGHDLALSSEKSTQLLYVPRGGSCMGSLVQEHSLKKTKIYSVECVTGDELAKTLLIPPPTLVKIDVEGLEMEVLKGMQGILKAFKPVVFLEHLFLDITVLYALEDYCIMTVADDGTLHEGFLPECGHNLALIPK